MLKSQDREINGAQYTSTTLPARTAIQLGTKLLKAFGPSLGELADSLETEGGKPVGVKGDALSRAVSMLVSQIDQTDVASLMLEILQSTVRVDPESRKRQEVGKGEVFDGVYSANYGELFGALRLALEVSLGDFFANAGITDLFTKAWEMAGAQMLQSSAPKDSTQAS
jgi:hypothetical protein